MTSTSIRKYVAFDFDNNLPILGANAHTFIGEDDDNADYDNDAVYNTVMMMMMKTKMMMVIEYQNIRTSL